MLETKEATNVTLLQVPENLLEHEDELKSTIQRLLSEGKKQILADLSLVSFTDSSGLGVLVNLYKMVKGSGGTLAFYGAQPYIKKLIELTKLHRVFSLYENEETGLAAFH